MNKGGKAQRWPEPIKRLTGQLTQTNSSLAADLGYTLVEVMIFLAISSALLISALSLVGGQQNKTEFTQAVRGLDSRLQDIFNDVSSGFYPNTGNITCDAPLGSGTVTFTPGGTEQGTNSNCTFIGRVIQFAPDGSDGEVMRVYTVAGRRLVTAGTPPTSREVSNIDEADPKLIADAGDGTPNAVDEVHLGPVDVVKVEFSGGAIGGLGVFTTFNSYTGSLLDSGSTIASLAAIQNTGINDTSVDFVRDSNTTINAAGFKTTGLDSPSGIKICVNSKGTNQHAVIEIGGNNRRLATKTTINSGVCP